MRFSVDGMGESCLSFGWHDLLTLVVGSPASTSTSAYKHEELCLALLALNVPPCTRSLCSKLKRQRHRETTPPADDADDGSYENDSASLSEF